MTLTTEQRNALNYAVLALAAFALGCATALVPQLMDPTMPDLNWRIVLGTGITAVVTAYGGAFLPRAGSTGLAQQVNDLRARGYSRENLTVVPTYPPADLATYHPVIHADCGRTAFLTEAPNVTGETIESGEAVHTDGRPFDVGTDPRCDACTAQLAGASVQGGVWVAASRVAPGREG